MMTEKEPSLRDEILGSAKTCGICRSVIPTAAVALVHRDEQNRVIGRACAHLYCRAQVREQFGLSHQLSNDYVN